MFSISAKWRLEQIGLLFRFIFPSSVEYGEEWVRIKKEYEEEYVLSLECGIHKFCKHENLINFCF